jgi:hypothetical protein
MKIKNYIFFIFLGLILSTCRKFPEDKFLSIDTVKGRLKGKWKIESIIFLGNDIQPLYNDSLQPLILDDVVLNFVFDFETSVRKSSSYYDKFNFVSIGVPDHWSSFSTDLKFIIVKKTISFEVMEFGVKGKFNKIFIENPKFEIRELYRGKFKIRNDLYEIKLLKIK